MSQERITQLAQQIREIVRKDERLNVRVSPSRLQRYREAAAAAKAESFSAWVLEQLDQAAGLKR